MNSPVVNIVLPSVVAGVIYFVIGLATDTSAGASIVGGLVVVVIALAIGFGIRAFSTRRGASG